MDTGYAQKKRCRARNRGVSPKGGKVSLGWKGSVETMIPRQNVTQRISSLLLLLFSFACIVSLLLCFSAASYTADVTKQMIGVRESRSDKGSIDHLQISIMYYRAIVRESNDDEISRWCLSLIHI